MHSTLVKIYIEVWKKFKKVHEQLLKWEDHIVKWTHRLWKKIGHYDV